MAGSLTIGQQHYYLKRSTRRRLTEFVVITSLMLAGCAAKHSPVPSDLTEFIPAGIKVSENFDRQTSAGRTAMIKVAIAGSVEDYVALFKTKARAAGYEEQVDRQSTAGRVIAYRASGDRTLTLEIATAPTGSTAAVVLANP
jgi:hypothetical protein